MPNDLRTTASGEAVFGEKVPADFIGHTASGRAVFIECKDHNASSLPIGSRGLKPHQWIALAELHNTGGIGLLVWSRGSFLAILDVDIIKSLTRGRKSVSWSAIPVDWKCPFTEAGALEILERHHV